MGQCCMQGKGEKHDDEEFADIRDEPDVKPKVEGRGRGGDNGKNVVTMEEKLAKYAAVDEAPSREETGEKKDEQEVQKDSPAAKKDESEAPPDPPENEREKTPEPAKEEPPIDKTEALKKKLQEMDEKKEKGIPVQTNVTETKMTAKQREAAEEEERRETDRKRKEAILAEGGVKQVKTFTWKDEDLEVADEEVEITMDGEDVIIAMDDEAEPTPEKEKEAPKTPLKKAPYPNDEWYATQGVKPPAGLSYYHVRDTLTLTFRPAPPATTRLEFTPPSVIHYKTPENEAYLDLLHDCTNSRLLSPSIPCLVSTDEDALRAAISQVTQDMTKTADLTEGYQIELKQIAELTLQSCSCMVRIVGPEGLEGIEALAKMAGGLKKSFSDGAEHCGIKFKLMEETCCESITLRLTKPSTARWSTLIKPPTGETLQPPPSWITPDDIDSDDEDDDDFT